MQSMRGRFGLDVPSGTEESKLHVVCFPTLSEFTFLQLQNPTRYVPESGMLCALLPAYLLRDDEVWTMGNRLTLFLCGDVMTGRGIDQILPFPGDSRLYERYMDSSIGYVELAERASGSMPHPVDFGYIWGDALHEFDREEPHAKLVNLETAITRTATPWPDKEVHYKMNPQNIGCLTAAGVDCCALANNHVLDWGISGLLETLEALDKADIKHAGAGRNLREAQAPAIHETTEGFRVIVFSLGSLSSGIPAEWSALEDRPGINLVETQADDPVRLLAERIREVRRKDDIIVVSIHWGANWGFKIPFAQKKLAHRLVDEATLNILHGHSSHHVKAMEVYKGCLILYGCGDFLNDYEGIAGYESFRADLGLMYFADIDPSAGRLLDLRMIPTQVRRLRVNRASELDSRWLEDVLNREGKRLGTRVKRSAENVLTLAAADDRE
jgi:poly-gamma-glutamate synthesis protein (capsule biosynthesis protein)